MTNDTESYNGYPNWSTWNVSMWAYNDEPMYARMRTLRSHFASADGTRHIFDIVFPTGETPDGAKLDDADMECLSREACEHFDVEHDDD